MKKNSARNEPLKLAFADTAGKPLFIYIGHKQKPLRLSGRKGTLLICSSHTSTKKPTTEEDGLASTVEITVNIHFESKLSQQKWFGRIKQQDSQLRCEQFKSCANEYCSKHGCLNVLLKSKEVRS